MISKGANSKLTTLWDYRHSANLHPLCFVDLSVYVIFLRATKYM